MTTSGGAYYATAVQLRQDAATARTSYPAALADVMEGAGKAAYVVRVNHAQALIVQAVGLELAAAVYCLAQAVEDSRR